MAKFRRMGEHDQVVVLDTSVEALRSSGGNIRSPHSS